MVSKSIPLCLMLTSVDVIHKWGSLLDWSAFSGVGNPWRVHMVVLWDAASNRRDILLLLFKVVSLEFDVIVIREVHVVLLGCSNIEGVLKEMDRVQLSRG